MKWLFVGDLHGRDLDVFEKKMREELIRTRFAPDCIVQVGDFGYYPATDPWPIDGDILTCRKMFIRGNHENHLALDLEATEPYGTEYGSWEHIPDGHFMNGVFFIGGARSIDRHYRSSGPYRYHEEEEMTSRMERVVMDQLYKHINEIHTIVSHEVPETLYRHLSGHHSNPVGTTTRFLNHVRQAMDDRYKPYTWIHGHHHNGQIQKIGDCRLVSLDMWYGKNIESDMTYTMRTRS